MTNLRRDHPATVGDSSNSHVEPAKRNASALSELTVKNGRRKKYQVHRSESLQSPTTGPILRHRETPFFAKTTNNVVDKSEGRDETWWWMTLESFLPNRIYRSNPTSKTPTTSTTSLASMHCDQRDSKAAYFAFRIKGLRPSFLCFWRPSFLCFCAVIWRLAAFAWWV
jgi:hypothetical protein